MPNLATFIADLSDGAPFTTEWLTGGAAPLSVPVAIVDSGIDAAHPELAGVVVRHFDATAEKPVPVEVPETNNDTYGHGTGVAGLVRRMCPAARLVDVRVLGPDNGGSAAALERGLRWALRSEARIVNLSLATSLDRILPMIEAIEGGYYGRKLLVSSRRNLPLRDEGYPAALVATLGVDNDGKLAPAHEAGDFRDIVRHKPRFSIEVLANGNRLPSLAPGGGYTTVTGTSFATPVVAGMCAALLARYPDAEPFELKIMIRLLAEARLIPARQAESAPAGAAVPVP